jgi:hypothetical protein
MKVAGIGNMHTRSEKKPYPQPKVARITEGDDEILDGVCV